MWTALSSINWERWRDGASCLMLCAIIASTGQYDFARVSSYLVPQPAPQEEHLQQVVATSLVPVVEAATLSTSTPERVIDTLTPEEAVPSTGKFIIADLVHMELYLYQDGAATATYPILTKGRPGTPYETPSGFYTILTKEVNHFNKAEGVNMPYSMEFYGNYFIHGWPTYADGTPVASTYSGGCIRLSTADAQQVYAFATVGTGVYVYDTGAATSAPALMLANAPVPAISAPAYLVADLDNGDVYAEEDGQTQRPIASLTKLMTALVANETIMFTDDVTVPRGDLSDVAVATDTQPETFVVGDLLYPLLMESNNNIANILASYYSTGAFVSWMNSQAHALDMGSTTFADPSGVSPQDTSTPEDLYRLAVYLANKKSFVWKITATPEKSITATDGSSYTFENYNLFSGLSSFVGGKVGKTGQAGETMISIFNVPVGSGERRVAIIVLDSQDYKSDTQSLLDWFTQSADASASTACASCMLPQEYRTIQL